MSEVDLACCDNLEAMAELEDNSIETCVVDPPYGLSKPPNIKEVLQHWLAGDDYNHRGSGFMGKSWDSFVPGPKTWEEVLRVLKPGGYLLCFAGSRTVDLMGMSIRLAGFEIRDQMQWLYGSGFPKGVDMAKAMAEKGYEESDQWTGWKSELKPAHEPIIVARKPFRGTLVDNVRTSGTGAYNIDGCRITTTDNLNGGAYAKQATEREELWGEDAGNSFRRGEAGEYVQPTGRFPANVLLQHHEDCQETEDTVVVKGDGRSGKKMGGTRPSGFGNVGSDSEDTEPNAAVYGDSGQSVWNCHLDCPVRILDEQSDRASRFMYCSKASKKDRNLGLPEGVTNKHPTVKNTELCRYLVRLVTPPGGSVLDPFMGSGTTGVACVLEGFNFIGVEMDEHSFDIAKARIQGVQND